MSHRKTKTGLIKPIMSYSIEVHMTGPGCNLDFVHESATEELASAIKQFAAILSNGGRAPTAAVPREKPIGGRVKAGGFDCPSQVFIRQTKSQSSRPLPTEIVQAPKLSGGFASARQALFGDDEEITAEETELGGEQLGEYKY